MPITTPATSRAELVPGTPRCALGESPRWDERERRLRWIDLPVGDVHSLDPRTGEVTTVAVGELVSAIAPYDDGWLVGVRRGVQWRDRDFELLDEIAVALPPETRMNDGEVDPAGRYFLGSMGSDERPGAGSLLRIDPDGQVTTMLTGLDIANGICWSHDGTVMFHADSGRGTITAFPYDVDAGSLGSGTVFYEHTEDEAVPDGIALDAVGGLWVALWDGGRVVRLDGEGEVTDVVEVEARRPSSVAFGGPDLDVLYVTSAADGVQAAGPGDGALHAFRPRHPGAAQNSVSTTPITWSSSSTRKTAR